MISSIRFSGDMPPWLVIVAVIAAAVGVLLYYLRETRSLDSPANFLIPSLRAAAVALVIVILAGPIWHSRTTVGTLGRVIFAIDQSDSMSSHDTSPTAIDRDSDSNLAVTRIDRVNRLLEGNRDSEGWLDQLSATHQVEVKPFSAGNHTDIASALASISGSRAAGNSSDSADSPPSRTAIVIFSDGRNNAGHSPVDEAALLHSTGASVHTIGMGNNDEPPGVGILTVDHPDSVAPDGSLVGKVQLTLSQMDDQQATIRIETANHETIWKEQVTLGVGRQQSIGFQLDVEEILQKLAGDSSSGIQRTARVMNLRAIVSSESEDWIDQNNDFEFRVAAATRKRRLLILDGGSRWEMRYLKNLFERDPGWTVNTVLFGIGTDNPRMLHGNDDGRYPNDSETMGKYDAVILGEIPAGYFDQRDAGLLRDFVTRGGGLVVIDGQYGQVAELIRSRFPELIPVRHDESESATPDSIQPTQLAIGKPMMDLFSDADQISMLWKNLPAPTMANTVSANASAEVWAELTDVGGAASPWLVTHLFGSGRVFYFASDQTWRWRYKVGDRFHARFWNRTLETVMQPPYSASDEYLAVGTDRIEYTSDAKPIIRARLQDSAGSPVGDATVDALVVPVNQNGEAALNEDQVIATVPLVIDDPQRGTYRGQASGLPPGAYEVRIRASGFDQTALRATTPIWVGGNDAAEWDRISVNDQALSSIAKAGGGQYRHESSADEIFNRLESLSTGRIVESDVSLWQSFYWFWAVLGLLTTEWVLRKRSGLV